MKKEAKNTTEDKLSPVEIYICKMLYEKNIDFLGYASETYNRALLSLSITTLGFTFAFLKFFDHEKPFNCLCMLRITWLLLILSIFFILVSLWADQRYSANEIKFYDWCLTKKGNPIEMMSCIRFVKRNFPIFSGLSFIFAILLFTVFVWDNI